MFDINNGNGKKNSQQITHVEAVAEPTLLLSASLFLSLPSFSFSSLFRSWYALGSIPDCRPGSTTCGISLQRRRRRWWQLPRCCTILATAKCKTAARHCHSWKLGSSHHFINLPGALYSRASQTFRHLLSSHWKTSLPEFVIYLLSFYVASCGSISHTQTSSPFSSFVIIPNNTFQLFIFILSSYAFEFLYPRSYSFITVTGLLQNFTMNAFPFW